MANAPTLSVEQWGGIKNRTDAQKVGLSGFTQADNVNIDGSGHVLFTRDGQTSINATPYLGAYATFDKTRCYAMTAAGELENWSGNAYTLQAGFIGYPYWCQIADVVFVGNEHQTWRIGPDHTVSLNALVQPAPPLLTAVVGGLPAGQYRFVQVGVVGGRESAPSVESIITVDGTQDIQVTGITGQRLYVAPADSRIFGWWTDTTATTLVYTQSAELLGEELQTLNLRPMPLGKCLAVYQGRLHAAVYEARTNQTALYRSLPQWWDLTTQGERGLIDFTMIPGEIRAMAGHAHGLLIATDRQLFALADDVLVKLADYGVAPGQAIAIDQTGQLWIWTQRGLCTAFPFAEVTVDRHAPPTADWVGSVVVRQDGDYRFVVTYAPLGDPDDENTEPATLIPAESIRVPREFP